MISAKEARKKTAMIRHSLSEDEFYEKKSMWLNLLEQEIKKKIQEGEYCVVFQTDMMYALVKDLKEAGYDVGPAKREGEYCISWI